MMCIRAWVEISVDKGDEEIPCLIEDCSTNYTIEIIKYYSTKAAFELCVNRSPFFDRTRQMDG